MKNILLILATIIFCTVSLQTFAENSVDEKVDKSEEIKPPSYTECFKIIQEKLSSEQQEVQKQIERRDFPINVEREKLDISSLNPRINPASDNVKKSLQIDLPQKEKETENSLFQCKILYGLE